MTTKPTDDQVWDQIEAAETQHGRYPGMTYEEGVSAALRWAIGTVKDPPMEENE